MRPLKSSVTSTSSSPSIFIVEGGLGALLDRRHLDLLEVLLPHAQVAALGVDLGPEADEVVVGVGVLLLPPGLVGGGHRLLEPLQDRLEGDALLSFQFPQRGDHLGVHALLPFSSAPQSTTVRADAMSACGTRRFVAVDLEGDALVVGCAQRARVGPRSGHGRRRLHLHLLAHRAPEVLRSPQRPFEPRRRDLQVVRARLVAPSSRWRETRSESRLSVSISTPPGRSTMTRRTLRPPSRPSGHVVQLEALGLDHGREQRFHIHRSALPYEREGGREPTSEHTSASSCPNPSIAHDLRNAPDRPERALRGGRERSIVRLHRRVERRAGTLARGPQLQVDQLLPPRPRLPTVTCTG